MDEIAIFEAMVEGLPHLEIVVAGHPDGYRAIATFGDLVHVCIDDDYDVAVALARAGLEAVIATSRS